MDLSLDLPNSKVVVTYSNRDRFIRVHPYGWEKHGIILKPEIGSVEVLNKQLTGGVHHDDVRILQDVFQTISNQVNYKGGTVS